MGACKINISIYAFNQIISYNGMHLVNRIFKLILPVLSQYSYALRHSFFSFQIELTTMDYALCCWR